MKELLIEIAHDTLKKKQPDGTFKWSRVSLTMFSAWSTALSMAIWDFITYGFRLDVWMTLIFVGIGMKWTDILNQKLNKKPDATARP